MSAGHSSQPLLSPRETVAVITARIKERRLYEARFLCRKLGQGLTAEQRAALEDQLSQSLSRVEQVHVKAKDALSSGNYEQARILYSQIEAVAIDVPGVQEELQNLRGAIALAERFAPASKLESKAEQPIVVEGGAPDPAQIRPATGLAQNLRSPVGHRNHRFLARKWLLGGVGLLFLSGAVGLFLFFQRGEAPPVSVSSASQAQSSKAVELIESLNHPEENPEAVIEEQTVPTKPALPVEKAASAAPQLSNSQAEPTKTAEHSDTPSGPALNLGGLQIE
nr:hypothetical protein [uncultured Desulfobulbus sp.]